MAVVAAAVHPPTTAVGDGGDLLDVDVEHVAGPAPLVTLGQRPRARRSITAIETADTGGPQDRLHRRGGQPDLERDVCRAPAVVAPQLQDLATMPIRGPVG